jgi:hypothetical protein
MSIRRDIANYINSAANIQKRAQLRKNSLILTPRARLREYGAARAAVARMTRRSSDFRERIARIATD